MTSAHPKELFSKNIIPKLFLKNLLKQQNINTTSIETVILKIKHLLFHNKII
jgi:hypothetical protein